MQTLKLENPRRLLLTALLAGLPVASLPLAARSAEDAAQLRIGKELFTREWLPNDKRSFAGDGLGPVHNARSCVACHNQGGVGGAGGRGSNSVIVNAFVKARPDSEPRMTLGIPPEDVVNPLAPYPQPDRTKLAKIHPDLRSSRSFILHRDGNEPAFDNWRIKLSSSIEPRFQSSGVDVGGIAISLIRSERNPPPLFGLSFIESISENQILAVAAEQARTAKPISEKVKLSRRPRDVVAFPISGRVLRLQDGKIGRFGWKNSIATIREFTALACATELGLEVPGRHRSAPPWIEDYRAPGLDLNEKQLQHLSQFIVSLPRPQSQRPKNAGDVAMLESGKKLFGNLGCAKCHRPRLGDVDGLYSDLLLHDMGQSLSGAGSYITTLEAAHTGDTTDSLLVAGNFSLSKSKEVLPRFGAGAREWRTPPLWGLRNSAPYLHDGRAKTLEEAIEQHDGEGLLAAGAFKKLSGAERMQLCTFLDSLTAPVPVP